MTYKSIVDPDEGVHRIIANCVSLAETSSFLFSRASEAVKLEREKLELNSLTSLLVREYRTLCQSPIKPDYDQQDRIYQAIEPLVPSDLDESLKAFVASDFEALRRALNKDEQIRPTLYSQPVILLLFYLARYQPRALLKTWPYLQEELEPLFVDLGRAMPQEVSIV